MRLKFWGVRGSTPVPGPLTLEFGGNTSCVELLDAGPEVILFDGGTGLRAAGLDLLTRAAGSPLRVHLLLTHFHWDHIQGIPFFAPLFQAGHHVTVYSSSHSAPLRPSLTGLMAEPYFPIGFDSFAARFEMVDLPNGGIEVNGVSIRPFEVNHPQGACAYRVDSGGSRFIYAPDREHGHDRLDTIFLDHARDTTALVVSAQYTPEEYERHRGWGHSTWKESATLACDAGVQSLILFHHDPSHSDDILRRIEADARRIFPDTFMAKEGWEFEL